MAAFLKVIFLVFQSKPQTTYDVEILKHIYILLQQVPNVIEILPNEKVSRFNSLLKRDDFVVIWQVPTTSICIILEA